MLRLGRLRPLATAVCGRGWTHFSRVYASTEASTHDTDAMHKILQEISRKDPVDAPRSTLPTDKAPGGTALLDQQEGENVSQLDALNFTEFQDPMFGDAKYTTRSYDKFYEAYPALKHEVDTDKLHAKLKYEQIYLKDHAHEPKTVFKFKNIVTKNYRTITRSWPMVRLDNFKYGHDYFLDEMYDDIEGKYYWNNQLAYPDGSINLFCGTSSKASPINVKGDPLALTYDDRLHNSDAAKPVQLRISKAEADARFPLRHEAEAAAKAKLAEKPRLSRPPRTPVPDFETEAEEDDRKEREKQVAKKIEREMIKELFARERELHNYIPDNLKETLQERRVRWRWETMEDTRRPWRTLANRGIHRSTDDRVLYDPATMVRLVSFSARGRMIERYYYRDELTPENTYIGTAKSDIELDPDFDEKLKVLGYREKNDWSLAASPAPNPEFSEAYCPHDPDAKEAVRHKVVTELLPTREKEKEGEKKKIEYKKKELRRDLLNEGVLPDNIRESMVMTFKELVAEKVLKPEDEWTYYNDYVSLTAKATFKARMEEYRKNKIHENPNVEFPGMWQVNPTYYFKYVKVNPGEGWIRFYVGEHNRAEKLYDTLIATDFTVEAGKETNAMKYPFVWKYSEYKLTPEEIAAMKQVKWPPSLIPPPKSPFQRGDGSPADQLAEYFERTYLQFGHDVRFNPNDCFDPEFDKLEDPNLKYARSVGSSTSDVQLVPDPGALDLSALTNLTQEQRAAEDKRLRGVIRRAASDAMDRETEALVGAYAHQVVIYNYYSKKTAEEIDKLSYGHSQLWISGNPDNIVDPDLVPVVNIAKPESLFRQRGDIVYAYDPTGTRVIQEYHGYKLYVLPQKLVIIRKPEYQNAKVVFYDEKGRIERTEYHPLPIVDSSVPHDRLRDRTGRSAWAFTSDAHATVAAEHGLPSKRAREIERAEQQKSEDLMETFMALDSAAEVGEGEEEGVDEKVDEDLKR